MKTLLSFLVLAFSQSIFAGDYRLYITSSESLDCPKYPHISALQNCSEGTGSPLCSSDQVSKELVSYFEGKKSSIKIMIPALTNGHIIWCDEASRKAVSDKLLEIDKSGVNMRGRALNDLVNMYHIST